MIDVGDSLGLDIADGVSLSDIIKNPDAHHWQIDWEFPSDEHRNRQATPNGKPYGTDSTFSSVYSFLKDDFIGKYFEDQYYYSSVREYGDDLLEEFNRSIGIRVETLRSPAGEVYKMHRNFDINKKRYYNAKERYDEYSERIEALSDEIYDMESGLVMTKGGSYDRRYSAYRVYAEKQRLLSDMLEEKYRLRERMESEWVRQENSRENVAGAQRRLGEIKEGIYSTISSDYARMADDFARAVREDIISRGESGVLPSQNLPLAEKTIRNRLYAGLNVYPRFWATGQLISSIRIKCTLV